MAEAEATGRGTTTDDTLGEKGCSVCQGVCKDPSVFPCARGDHAVCKDCVVGVTQGSSVTCPICEASHAEVQCDGIQELKGLTMEDAADSGCSVQLLCKQCKKASVDASSSGNLFCGSCRAARVTAYNSAKQTIENLRIVVENAQNEIMDPSKEEEMRLHGLAVEREIDDAMDLLLKKLEEKQRTLKADMMKAAREKLEEKANQRKQVMADVRSYANSVASVLGDEYGKHVSDQQMKEITAELTQKKETLKEMMDQMIEQADVLPIPVMNYDYDNVCSKIASFGSIVVEPPGSGNRLAFHTEPEVLDEALTEN